MPANTREDCGETNRGSCSDVDQWISELMSSPVPRGRDQSSSSGSSSPKKDLPARTKPKKVTRFEKHGRPGQSSSSDSDSDVSPHPSEPFLNSQYLKDLGDSDSDSVEALIKPNRNRKITSQRQETQVSAGNLGRQTYPAPPAAPRGYARPKTSRGPPVLAQAIPGRFKKYTEPEESAEPSHTHTPRPTTSYGRKVNRFIPAPIPANYSCTPANFRSKQGQAKPVAATINRWPSTYSHTPNNNDALAGFRPTTSDLSEATMWWSEFTKNFTSQ